MITEMLLTAFAISVAAEIKCQKSKRLAELTHIHWHSKTNVVRI